jgi:hypothetical protein
MTTVRAELVEARTVGGAVTLAAGGATGPPRAG